MPEKSNGSAGSGSRRRRSRLRVGGEARRVGTGSGGVLSGERRYSRGRPLQQCSGAIWISRRIRLSECWGRAAGWAAVAPLHYRTFVTDSQRGGNAPVALGRNWAFVAFDAARGSRYGWRRRVWVRDRWSARNLKRPSALNDRAEHPHAPSPPSRRDDATRPERCSSPCRLGSSGT